MENSIPDAGTRQTARALPWLFVAGMLNAVFGAWTIFGSVFLLFLTELGLPDDQIGAVLSLIPFACMVGVVIAPWLQKQGWKRTFLAGYGARKLVIATLLLLPWLINAAGHTAGVVFVVVIVALFALMRASAETAYYPWMQEFIPDRLRGRVGGLQFMLISIATALAIVVAGWVIGHGAGLQRFQILIAGGCTLGFLGVLLMTRIPGGAPRPAAVEFHAHRRELAQALSDRNFRTYLSACGVTTCGLALGATFLPLYLIRELHLPAGTVITLDLAVLAGGALAALVFGWAADRFGSRPALLPLILFAPVIPLAWLLLPALTTALLPVCAALYFLTGAVTVGLTVVAARLLVNSVVPRKQSGTYLAIHYAWMGVVGGGSCLAAGAILTVWDRRPWLVDSLHLHGQAVLFCLSCGLLAFGGWLYSKVRSDEPLAVPAAVRIATQ